jgi:SAM-dependent methyltransferase
VSGPGGPGLGQLLDRWRDELAAWAIPEDILAGAEQSPWVLARQVFARRADRLTAAPEGPSFGRAWAALDPPGSVLDVGSGAGAACLPLLPRTTALTAVDADREMLDLLARRTERLAGRVRLVQGRWPDVAPEAAPADLVTCFNVTYNVPDILPFLAALTASARRLVVLEMTAQHPLVSLNPLWLRFHGLRRPDGPTADDLLAILAAMGTPAGHRRWERPGGADFTSFDDLVDVTRRRLCLSPDRAKEVAEALEEQAEQDRLTDLGTTHREVVTIWWAGSAAGRDYLE